MGERIGVIGAGAWGTALAKVLAECGHEVAIWHNVIRVRELFRGSRAQVGAALLNRLYCKSGFIVGKSMTSRIEKASVRSMTRRSTPMPIPPVGGMPTSRLDTKSSSKA